jgi:Flp pilus assembly pilin Flp
MNFVAKIKTFAADESGAVTVDWVVLTAAIVGLGIAVIASVRGGTESVANAIGTSLSTGAQTVQGVNFTTGQPNE